MAFSQLSVEMSTRSSQMPKDPKDFRFSVSEYSSVGQAPRALTILFMVSNDGEGFSSRYVDELQRTRIFACAREGLLADVNSLLDGHLKRKASSSVPFDSQGID